MKLLKTILLILILTIPVISAKEEIILQQGADEYTGCLDTYTYSVIPDDTVNFCAADQLNIVFLSC